MVDKEDKSESAERNGNDEPGGGSVSRSLSSFCIRRLSLAACAIPCFCLWRTDFEVGRENGDLLLALKAGSAWARKMLITITKLKSAFQSCDLILLLFWSGETKQANEC